LLLPKSVLLFSVLTISIFLLSFHSVFAIDSEGDNDDNDNTISKEEALDCKTGWYKNFVSMFYEENIIIQKIKNGKCFFEITTIGDPGLINKYNCIAPLDEMTLDFKSPYCQSSTNFTEMQLCKDQDLEIPHPVIPEFWKIDVDGIREESCVTRVEIAGEMIKRYYFCRMSLDIISDSGGWDKIENNVFLDYCTEIATNWPREPVKVSPKQQFALGIYPKDIMCNSDTPVIIIKKQGGSGACVTKSTAQKLIARGWAQDFLFERNP